MDSVDCWVLGGGRCPANGTLEGIWHPMGSRTSAYQALDPRDSGWVADCSSLHRGRTDIQNMSQTLHVHLVYVGKGRFQLTLTLVNKSNPLVEIMTFGDLQRSIRGMKPGAKTIRFAKTTIDCADLPLDQMRAYFKKVYDKYEQAKADGRDLDAELERINRPDLTAGSGGLCMN